MTDRFWHQRDPMEVRDRDGSGRASAGWVALALVVLYSVVLALVLSVSNGVSAADLAGAGAARHPFDDPPVLVARAEFVVGLVAVAALPTALAAIALGYRGVVRGWVAGRRVGWVALVIGGVGLLPAFLASALGVLVCILDGGAIAA